ncbi:MAG: DUF5131 family protein [Sedimentisphaerales bacterium]|nr:DUF5131 family protein [Sedimentisphaerales bacterium]
MVKKAARKNMYKASVKQWNPFCGCNFKCVYCTTSFQAQVKRYSNAINPKTGKRNCPKCSSWTPHNHPERLDEYLPITKKGEFIFVCSNGDISFCPTPYLKQILKRIDEKPDRTFLLQSKNPITFNRIKSIPDNLILGTTIETNRDALAKKVSKAPKVSKRFEDFLKVKHHMKMITIEPVLEFDINTMLEWCMKVKPVMIWMGYDSKKKLEGEPTLTLLRELRRRLNSLRFNVILKTVRQK